ncbi:MAG TPA: 50S ribosomal protein L23 [Planctomycetota bacterium]|nr:50S ribosomal protein L23 [Planctomycetota bacterium]
MLRDAYAIVKKPRITEKSTFVSEKTNAYTFEVARDANKIEIRQAIEKLFKVKVTQVRTQLIKGKPKRVKMNWGYTPDWKKAIVTLAEGQRIDVM